jgi:hypothetical protein
MNSFHFFIHGHLDVKEGLWDVDDKLIAVVVQAKKLRKPILATNKCSLKKGQKCNGNEFLCLSCMAFVFKVLWMYMVAASTFLADLAIHCLLVADSVVDSCHGSASANSVARGNRFHFLQHVIVMEFWVFATTSVTPVSSLVNERLFEFSNFSHLGVSFQRRWFLLLLLLIPGFGVIHSNAVEEGFRAVDRRFFVPQVSAYWL